MKTNTEMIEYIEGIKRRIDCKLSNMGANLYISFPDLDYYELSGEELFNTSEFLEVLITTLKKKEEK